MHMFLNGICIYIYICICFLISYDRYSECRWIASARTLLFFGGGRFHKNHTMMQQYYISAKIMICVYGVGCPLYTKL